MKNYKYITSTKDPNFDRSIKWLERLNLIGLDIEANGLNPHRSKILLVQLGTPNIQYVYDVHKLGFKNVFNILCKLNNNLIVKIAHNAAYEYKMIKGFFGINLNNLYCTMVTAEVSQLGKFQYKGRFSLYGVLKYYLNTYVDKEEQSSFSKMKYGDNFTEEQIKYAASDVENLVPLYREIRKQAELKEMSDLVDIEGYTAQVTGEMEFSGVLVDVKEWKALIKKAKLEAEKRKDILREHFRPFYDEDVFGELIKPSKKKQAEIFNYDSPYQIKPALEQVLGYEIESTDKNVLKEIDHPAAKAAMEYKKYRKLVTSYGNEFLKRINPYTGRIHPRAKQVATETSRYTFREPNLQQIPATDEYRKAFKARKGYKIISADFSGQELRLLAYLSKDENLKKAVQPGMDPHCYSASLLYNIPYKDFFDANGEIKPDMKEKYRKPAKSITFGLVYGMGVKKLAKQLDIFIKDAKDLLNQYFKIFKDVKILMDDLTNKVFKNRYAISPLDGKRRHMPTVDFDSKADASSSVNTAKNFPFQGAGATITKLAMIKVHNKIQEKKLNARILVQIHDEIVCEVQEDEAETFVKIVENKMQEAFKYFAPDVDMPVDAFINDYWVH